VSLRSRIWRFWNWFYNVSVAAAAAMMFWVVV
jgi:hypothetical protein